MQIKPRTLKEREPKQPAPSFRDVFDLDFPHERIRMSRMDKYTLRDWIVGKMVIKGWQWSFYMMDELGQECLLTMGDVEVRVGIRSDGVRLVCGENVKSLKTEL